MEQLTEEEINSLIELYQSGDLQEAEKKAMDFSKFLKSKGIFAQAIRYPTVKKDQARIRISITGWLSDKEIEYSIGILEKARIKFKLK